MDQGVEGVVNFWKGKKVLITGHTGTTRILV